MVKWSLRRVGHQLGEFSEEVAVSGVEIAASMYQTTLMQNTPTVLTTAVIIGVDVLQGLLMIRLFMDKTTTFSGVQQREVTRRALELLSQHAVTAADLLERDSSRPGLSSVSVVPGSLNGKTQDVVIVHQALEIAQIAENILLTEYCEVMLPVINGLFLVLVSPHRSTRFNPTLCQFYYYPSRLPHALQNLVVYSSLQGLTVVLMMVIMRRRYRLSSLSHLAFVLERHVWSVQGKLLVWLPIFFYFSVVHFGVRSAFRRHPHRRYTVSKFMALQAYAQRTTAWRLAAVLVLYPLPCLSLAVASGLIPLQEPALGISRNWGFLVQSTLGCFVVGVGTMVMAFASVQVLHSAVAMREVVAIGVLTALQVSAAHYLLASLWRFPVPFMMAVMVWPECVSLVLASVLVLRSRLIGPDPSLRQAIGLSVPPVFLQVTQVIVYPSLTALFKGVSEWQQLLLTLALPILKFVVKKALRRAARFLGEFSEEVAVSGVEIAASMYQTTLMQNAPTFLTTAVIIGVDVAHGLLLVRLFMDKSGAEIASQRRELFAQAVQLVSSGHVTETDLVVRRPTARPSQRFIAVQPNQPKQKSDNVRVVLHALEIAQVAESILLTEYCEVALPVVNGVFLWLVSPLHSSRFNPTVCAYYYAPARLHRVLRNLALYSALQGLTVVMMVLVMRKRYRLSPLAHLSFVLERHVWSLQGKLLVWLSVFFYFPTVHYGTDFEFKFDFEKILQESDGVIESVEPVASTSDQITSVYVFEDTQTGGIQVEYENTTTDTTQLLAWASFNDSLDAIGWSQLNVETTSVVGDGLHYRRVMYAAGVAEGMLTHHRIDQHFHNIFESFFPNDDAADRRNVHRLHRFLQQTREWMDRQIKIHDLDPFLPDAAYWDAVSGVLQQFDGLVAGYQRASQANKTLSKIDLMLLNSNGDLLDLIPVVERAARREAAQEGQVLTTNPVTDALYMFLKKLKCSALVRLLPDRSDVVWGHATWETYAAMNRVFKHINVPLPPSSASSTVSQPRRRVSMSSSPAALSSIDDWYLTDAGLGVLETTNGVFNEKLYDAVTPHAVPCWVRSVVATRLATDGPSWASTFANHNSGTYNNQWMVVDTKRFTPGHGFEANGFMVLEQLPGYIEVQDMSSHINAFGYWASYNVPYFDTVYARSGYLNASLSSNDSESWSYTNCSRARIFQRDAPTVSTIGDLKRLLRLNRWRSDPLSQGDPAHAIAARYDLESESSRMFAIDGAIDAKVTSITKAQRLECDAEAGPTHDDNPVFEWTPALSALSKHRGHPQRFAFGFERVRVAISPNRERRYTASKFQALHAYTHVSNLRLAAVLLLYPLPSLTAAVLPALFPLNDLRWPASRQWGFALHYTYISFIGSIGTIVGALATVGALHVVISIKEIVMIATLAALQTSVALYTLSSTWRFPVPFMMAITICPWGVSASQQLLLTLALPLMKLAIKTMLRRAGHRLGEFSEEIAVGGVEIAASMYQTAIMKNAPTAVAIIVIIIGMDALHGLVGIWLFMDKPIQETTRQRHEIVSHALRLLSGREVLEADLESGGLSMSASPPAAISSSLAPVLPQQCNQNVENVHVVLQALQIAQAAESILLTEYLEVILPVVNGFFLAVVSRFDSSRYNPTLCAFHYFPTRLHDAIRGLAAYAALQSLTVVMMMVVMRKRYRLSSFAQLAFVLERHVWSLQGKLLVWLPLYLHFSLVHYGMDFTLEFDFQKLLTEAC
ncbi:hypothetical protein P43SY_007739 [Pythium insidiosum]|uniref:Phospholipase B-like n=1 Tax=Pythium insidiosum TaxID=114742 RepID=A0AAD5Q562_PYTIN|nr:hypothetical protein P43SY_007739 [Pythium insidiosum]